MLQAGLAARLPAGATAAGSQGRCNMQNADHTRRGGIPPGVAAAAYGMLIEIPHFLMERWMLLGVKEREERSRA